MINLRNSDTRLASINQVVLYSARATGVALALGLVMTGCGEPDASYVEASEAMLRRIEPSELVGTIAFGETKSVEHPAQTTYLAYAFDATAGDDIELGVQADDHDARLWLVGLRGETLRTVNTFSDVREETVAYRIKTSGRYVVAFREANREPARFTVRLAKKGAAATSASPPSTSTECAEPNVAGCGTAVTLTADDHSWYGHAWSPFAVGTYGDLWSGTVSGDFRMSGLRYPNARLEDDLGVQTPLSGSWRSFDKLSARSAPAKAVVWAGAPGTGDSTYGVSVYARNVRYVIERTRDVEDHGSVTRGAPFVRKLGQELHGLSLAFDIELRTEDNFTTPCPVTVGDTVNPTSPGSRQLARFTGPAVVKRSFVATPPIKIEMGAYGCGERKAHNGSDVWYRLTNVRISRP